MVSALSFGPDVPAYVWAAGIVLALTLLILARSVSNRFHGARPPVFEEIPFLGGIWGFINSPIGLARRGYDALGEVCASAFPASSPAVLSITCKHGLDTGFE
jgi:hypothetical protein